MPQIVGRQHRGGAAIAAGGFGCVFRPSLRCKAGSAEADFYDPHQVSKLMKKQDANEEIAEIMRVMPVLRLIPNADRYFMGVGAAGGFYACEPAPLTAIDKIQYDKCRPLIRRGFTAKNINNKLSNLRTINQSYGGLELNVAWGLANHAGTDPGAASMVFDTHGFKAINSSLQRLLVHAIVPLNMLGVLHGDIKAANILVSKGPSTSAAGSPFADEPIQRVLEMMTEGESRNPGALSTRIIDWGLTMFFRARSGPMSSFPERVPRSLRQGKYTLFNMPITAILLDDAMQPLIKKLVRSFLPTGNVSLGRMMAMRNVANRVYLIHLRSVGGHGHDDYLLQILGGIFYGVPLTGTDPGNSSSDDRIDDRSGTTQNIIINYLASALDRYTDEHGNFKRDAYFHEVFRLNCDVYGLLTCYLPLIEPPMDVPISDIWSRNSISNGVARILAEYCYGPRYAAEPIPVQQVVEDLRDLNRSSPRMRHMQLRMPVAAGTAGGPGHAPARAQAKPRSSHPAAAAAPVAKRKRCPKGTRRDKKTGKCVKTQRSASVRRHGSSVKTVSAGKRCPRGYRRDKTTGKCHRTRKK